MLSVNETDRCQNQSSRQQSQQSSGSALQGHWQLSSSVSPPGGVEVCAHTLLRGAPQQCLVCRNKACTLQSCAAHLQRKLPCPRIL